MGYLVTPPAVSAPLSPGKVPSPTSGCPSCSRIMLLVFHHQRTSVDENQHLLVSGKKTEDFYCCHISRRDKGMQQTHLFGPWREVKVLLEGLGYAHLNGPSQGVALPTTETHHDPQSHPVSCYNCVNSWRQGPLWLAPFHLPADSREFPISLGSAVPIVWDSDWGHKSLFRISYFCQVCYYYPLSILILIF